MTLNDTPSWKVLLRAIVWAIAYVGGAVGAIILVFYGILYHTQLTGGIMIGLILVATVIGRYLHLTNKW